MSVTTTLQPSSSSSLGPTTEPTTLSSCDMPGQIVSVSCVSPWPFVGVLILLVATLGVAVMLLCVTALIQRRRIRRQSSGKMYSH